MGRCVIPVEKCAVATLLSGLAEKKIDVVFSLHTHGMVQTTQKKALWQGQTGWLKSGPLVENDSALCPPELSECLVLAPRGAWDEDLFPLQADRENGEF